MTSVGAFNDMMGQFLSELVQTFPEDKTIKKYESNFELIRKSNPRKVVETYMEALRPYQDRVMARDESLLVDNALVKELGLTKSLWDDCSDNTKNAIWQYIQTLLMLGTTITALPADTLKAIESVAEATAGQMSQGDDANGENLMKMFGNLLGNIQK